jgi:hypothetical protein
MFRSSSLLRRQCGWRRKLVLAALFALQGAITFAPLLEVSERGRLGAHAEERGAQHKYQHDEATCAVCAVRSLHSAPSQHCPAIDCEQHRTVAALDAPWAPARRAVSSALPRAPPQQN